MSTINSANGQAQGVTTDKRSMNEAITERYALAATLDGWAFVFSDNTVTVTAAADRFARVWNTDEDEQLVITKIVGRSATADVWDVLVSPNYTEAGTHAAGTAKNMLASKVAVNLATAKGGFSSDVDIQGDSGVYYGRIGLTVADTDYILDLSDDPLVIDNGYSLVLAAVTGGFVISYEIYGYWRSVPTTTAT